MTMVYIGVGSNIEPRRHIRRALALLGQQLGKIETSPLYACPAVGFSGDDFINLVVAVDTELDLHAVVRVLHDVEAQCGRVRGQTVRARTMDLDLLLFGDRIYREGKIRLPREDILEYAFVLKPLADIAGNARHPVDGRSYAALWQAFDAPEQTLREVTLD